MIRNIHIENFALIKDQLIELKPGLNIITGETGSGKSIFAAAIAGAFGHDITENMIYHGEDSLNIQCEVELDKSRQEKIRELTGIDPDGETYVVSRTIRSRGRNIARLNGAIVSISMLRDIGEVLFDLHTQHETGELLRRENQTRLLEQFCDNEFNRYLQEYNSIYRGSTLLRKKLKDITENIHGAETRKEMLDFQIQEIERAGLRENEYDELNRKKDLLINSEKIIKSLSLISSLMIGEDHPETNICDSIKKVSKELDYLSDYQDDYAAAGQELEDMYWRLKEIAEDMNSRLAGFDYAPAELDDIIGRIDFLDRIRKKYGDSYSDIMETLQRKKEELGELENSDNSISKITREIAGNETKMMRLNDILLEKRKKAAEGLIVSVVNELRDLDMPNARFDIRFSDKKGGADRFFEGGNHEVRFSISANKGQPLKYLDEVSSGGEMARVMLVLKKLASATDDTDVMVFDEIESGISGATAFNVGKKICDISKDRQVICITHIPQITVFAENHYKTYKKENDGKTYTVIEELDDRGKIAEIGKLLGGNTVGENAFLNAEELFEAGRAYRFSKGDK